MSKAKRGSKENPVTADELAAAAGLLPVEKTLEIKAATIKDDFCTYSYAILKGVATGDLIKDRTGANIIHSDMSDAFDKLNVHLAVIDDAFKYSKIEITNINIMYDHELTLNFDVNKFKISGKNENKSVTLYGTKWISEGDHISLETPKIKFNSGYKWKEELKEAVDDCIREVEEYMDGKCTPKAEQTEIKFPETDDFAEAAL